MCADKVDIPQDVRWKAVIVLDVVTETVIVVVAAVLFTPVQISRKYKFFIIIAFGTRLP